MGNTTKFCIVLFLIFVLIYLLESSNSLEYFTKIPSTNDISSMMNTFNNNQGFTSQSNPTTISQTTNDEFKPLTGAGADVLNTAPLENADSILLPKDPKTYKDEMTSMGSKELGNDMINYYSNQMADNLKQKDFSASDFLPQEINSEWFNTDLSKAQKEVDQATLIDVSRFCQGVDTVGQSLKNPSYDIRGNIPNPKISVSPFLNSSYDPDTNIKTWC